MDKKYKYLGYFFSLLIPLTFFAFYKTYIIQIPDFEPKNNSLIHLHVIISCAWLFILIAQPILIANRKTRVHRLLGKISYVVFPLFILSFIPQILRIIREENYQFLFFPVGDCVLLISFYVIAMYYRKTVYKHMRYVIAGALVFLGPTIGRIGPIWFGWSEVFTQNIQYTIIYSILVGLILYDKSNHRKFHPYLVSILFFMLHQAVFYIIFL